MENPSADNDNENCETAANLASPTATHSAAGSTFQKMHTWGIYAVLFGGVVAALVGGLIYMFNGTIICTKDQQAEADISAIKTALRTYEMCGSQLPTTEQGIQALVTRPTVEPIPHRWTRMLEEVPLDPWGRPYVYRNPGLINPEGYDLYSLGPDGMESDVNIHLAK